MNWISRLAGQVADNAWVARGVIVSVEGPTSRAVGTAMMVTAGHHEGRVGRPELMDSVIALARRMIEQRRAAGDTPLWLRQREVFATGAVLGESSGGRVEILIEVFGPGELRALEQTEWTAADNRLLARPLASGVAIVALDPAFANAPAEWRSAVAQLVADPSRLLARTADEAGIVERISPKLTPFHVYGTGLVARALVGLLGGLPFDVVWHDRAPARFPSPLPAGVRIGTAGTLAEGAYNAAPGSFHAVMTGDHAEDLAVCRVLSRHGGFGFLGVIGAQLKRDRLIARLAADGIGHPVLDRIACPVGLAGIRGKDPNVISLSIAAQALLVLQGASGLHDRAGTNPNPSPNPTM